MYHAVIFAWDSISQLETAGTFWDPPLYPIKTLLAISAIVLLLQGFAQSIRDLYFAVKGEEIS